jgi:hypothetical protein
LVANTISAGQLATGELITLKAQIKDATIDTAHIVNLSVITLKIANQAVTRGAQYYNAATYNWSDVAEKEIGTVTVVTNEYTDEVWIWLSADVVQWSFYFDGSIYITIPITFRLRRDSMSGTIIISKILAAMPGELFLMISDTPGGSAGSHVYKLTAQGAGAYDSPTAGVATRRILALAKSR